jgi:hypothetical protein
MVWHPRHVYETAELTEQKLHSLPPFDKWFVNLLQTGQLPIGPNPNIALSCNLLESAKKFSPALRALANDTSVGMYLGKRECLKWSSGALRGWVFPALREARAGWERRFGRWPWEPVNEWGDRPAAPGLDLNKRFDE